MWAPDTKHDLNTMVEAPLLCPEPGIEVVHHTLSLTLICALSVFSIKIV
ncbi:hypothetical protein [Archaeoglobus neptunius]|nr:hypothetical protein [Archaeoglobus neptunius]